MAKNETGITITIKAWLPTGKGLDEQFAALSLVKQAHSTGDYAPLLAAAQIEAVLTDSKTRRVEDVSAEMARIIAEVEKLPDIADEELPSGIIETTVDANSEAGRKLTGLADPADATTSTAGPINMADVLPKTKLARSRQTPELDAARDELEAAGA